MGKSKTSQGKDFEKDFENSFPISTWVYRIPDNATSFGTSTARFTNDSRYDYLCWNGLTSKELYSFELKSCEGTSIPFADYAISISYERAMLDLVDYRKSIKGTQNNAQKAHIKELKDNEKDLSKKCKSKSIKYHQIKNLYIDSLKGSNAYFIFNFRKCDITYALPIDQFIQFWETTTKKSINQEDIESLKHIVLPQESVGRSKHWKYDVSVLGIHDQTLDDLVSNIMNSTTPFTSSIQSVRE